MLSPYRLAKARDLYNIFNVFNSLSWQFLIGNIITIFAMRLHASSTYLGTLSALLYVAFFFLPLGKVLASRFSIVKIFSFAWSGRAICMITLFFAPLVATAGHRDLALGLTVLGVLLFHVIRGIGMIGNNPVLSLMASGPDRGSYMTQIQIINSAVGMFASFAIAILLGRDPPLYLYSVIVAVGIGCGIFSGILMGKIPEPSVDTGGKKIKFFDVFKQALSQANLRQFIVILFIVALVSGVSRAFIVVYSREVFMQSDGMVSLYTVFGGLGNLMIGMLIKFLVDRTGAKPIFILCVFMGLVSMVPIIFFPQSLDNLITIILFLTFLFFMLNFGFLGAEGIAQTYFLALVPSELMLDMGIVYFFVFGIAGTGGSFLAGLFLDIMTGLGVDIIIAFRALYLVLIALTGLVLFFQRKLTPLGALPFRGALEVIFSFRDLKAISLLDKLNKTSDSQEEEALLGALHDTPSRLATKGLLDRAKSPRLATRLESLRAMESLESLTEDAEKALIDDIIHNPFTTAYISARILGNHGVFAAIPLLRELAASHDYMLAGEAMIALAKLGDEVFRPRIEEIVLGTDNPRLKIMGVEALGIYQSPNSISVLLDILRVADPPPYLRDEVVLAMASILDTQNQFYPILVHYLENESLAPTLAADEVDAACEFYNATLGGGKKNWKKPGFVLIARQAKALPAAASAFMDRKGALLSQWILELPDKFCHSVVQMVLAEAVLDDELCSHRRLQLLIVHWTAYKLRIWTQKLKEKEQREVL
ncbi:MAG: MFS transporter [Treponema sp.]|jgi:MFS family permease|nr:MFS transporter [Treponema sp.]